MRPAAQRAASLIARGVQDVGPAAPLSAGAASARAWLSRFSAGKRDNNAASNAASCAASRALATHASLPPAPSNMRVLVTGASGQIGCDLVPFLRSHLAPGAVLATDVRPSANAAASATSPSSSSSSPSTHFTTLDCTDAAAFAKLAREHGATHIVHLAALLSARCEEDPDLAIRVNSRGTEAALSAARSSSSALLLPSTIGVYGLSPEMRARNLPSSDDPSADPGRSATLYGVTKAYAEGLGGWYAKRRGVDFRALRLPGVLSATPPGGGTTDYALFMLESAARAVMAASFSGSSSSNKKGLERQQHQPPPPPPPYRCFVGEGVALPFMHASDTLAAFWRLLVAPRSSLSRRVYNVGAVTAAPRDWQAAFERAARETLVIGGGGGAGRSVLVPVVYAPDHRDAIARSWPTALDCSAAARDWGYAPQVADVDAIARRLLSERLDGLLGASLENNKTSAVASASAPPPPARAFAMAAAGAAGGAAGGVI